MLTYQPRKSALTRMVRKFLPSIWISFIQDALPMPAVPEQSPAPAVNPHIVLRAVLVIPDSTLNIAAYNAFLEEEI